MATTLEEDRAIKLAKQATDLVDSGRAEDGARALREAVSLAPDNELVRSAFAKLNLDESSHALMKLCQRFAQDKDFAAGKEAQLYLESRGAQVTAGIANQCLPLVIEADLASGNELKDSLLASFLLYSIAARTYLGERLRESITVTFNKVFHIGDGAANGMAATVLDSAIWPDDVIRIECENGVFQLFMAKLMESGHDYDGRAMKGISRLLAVDAERLESLLDEDSFDAILAALDIRWPVEVRSQATLATAKYLEVAKEKGEEYLTRFITTRVKRHAHHDLVIAFSAAAATFPLVPSVAATLFLTEGFLPSLVSLLEKDTQSRKIEQAALEMLNAACIDSACREAVAKYCSRWLHFIMRTSQGQGRGQAAVVIAKVKGAAVDGASSEQPENPTKEGVDIVSTFEAMLMNGIDSDERNATEGLAYVSMQPKTKEAIAKNQELLKKLMHVSPTQASAGHKHSTNMFGRLKASAGSGHWEDAGALTAAFGTLTTIDNLTRYPPTLSEEQKRMSQLKAYANAAPSLSNPDPLDDEAHVDERCRAVIDADALPYFTYLVRISKPKGLSPTCHSLFARIILSLAKLPANRGKLSQQGAVALALQIAKELSADRRTAAHALARILISINPALLKSHIKPIVPILLTLLNDDGDSAGDGPRDLLPQFEALLALTNLASDPKLDAGQDIVRESFAKVEDLQLGSNPLIQRAATELMCNLMTSSNGMEKFADGSPAADRRIHILLALADAEDMATRRAAGGALAMATEFEAVVKSVLARERGVKILLALCEDEDQGCVHRGCVCVRNLVVAEGETGKKGREVVKGIGGVEALKEVLKRTRDGAVLQMGFEALKVLMT
ncbi:hypothetical protein MMC30_003639 [Trapelia coarctata]|nr:hypothetical protein [Trapelia coarctata]